MWLVVQCLAQIVDGGLELALVQMNGRAQPKTTCVMTVLTKNVGDQFLGSVDLIAASVHLSQLRLSHKDIVRGAPSIDYALEQFGAVGEIALCKIHVR